jgi:hypothetical protein
VATHTLRLRILTISPRCPEAHWETAAEHDLTVTGRPLHQFSDAIETRTSHKGPVPGGQTHINWH